MSVEEVIYNTGEISIPIAVGCEIVNVRISEADKIKNNYKGSISFIDHIEHGIRGEYGWIAEAGTQIHKVFNRKYLMDINPAEPFWGEEMFTLNRDIDRDMRHFIMHAILKYNPELPESL